MADIVKVPSGDVIERVVIEGDLSRLTPADRIAYYRRVCETIGVNPFTKPFDYITLNGKLTLYAKRDCTDQLRKIHNLTVNIVSRERMDDLYVVTARGTLPNGRADESVGAVCLAGLRGDALANAIMKAETKAKRRVTLSIVGLGWLDETEIETIPDARPAMVDPETGEIKGAQAQPQPANGGNGAAKSAPVAADPGPEDIAWRGQYHGWLSKVVETNSLPMPPDEFYQWCKDNGHLREHLHLYKNIAEAQKATLAALSTYKIAQAKAQPAQA